MTLALDAYFARIGYGGDSRPSLENLGGILRAHMRAIPFENLDVLLRRPIRIDEEGLETKLVKARRGGYCFEHASLLGTVLERLGFDVARHVARVTMFVPRAEAGRTHMFLVVRLPEGRFVVDPGFGSLAARVPVPLDGAEARHQHEVHALVNDGPFTVLQVRFPESTVDAWATTFDHDFPIDFELGNHWTATHPSSGFVNRLMLRALTEGGRVSVMNRTMTVRRGSDVETRELADRGELRALLVEHFGIDLPEVATMRVPTIPEWA